MIRRLVKMEFEERSLPQFLELFREVQPQIAAFPGCQFVTMYQQIERPSVCFTWSIWDSDEALQGYRNSELFARTWTATKALFAARAEAWSLDEWLPPTP